MRKLFVLLLAAVFALSACSGNGGPGEGGPGEGSGAGEGGGDSAAPVFELKDAVYEYGEQDGIFDNGASLYSYLLFPKTGEPGIDEEIRGWAESLYNGARFELDALRKGDGGAECEINVQYNSYLAEDAYAGIAESGFSGNSGMAHPVDFYKTFNIDLKQKKLLDNADIIDEGKRGDVLDILKGMILEKYPDADVSAADASWIEHIVLNHGGIEVLIPRGIALAAYLGPQEFSISRETLGAAYILDRPAELSGQDAPADAGGAGGADPPAAGVSGSIDPSKPMLALTFDDGPSKYTPQILDVLAAYGVNATFCVVGNRVEGFGDTARQIAAQGSQIMGHSWDHKQLTKLSNDEIASELNETNRVINDATGVSPVMYRPPYGAVNDTLKAVSKDLGLSLVNWSVDTRDWESRDADAVYAHIMEDARDGCIILCHDSYESTANAVARAIPELVGQGYQLVTVEELLRASGTPIEPGVVYFGK
ncbi:MAG: polysaccharide deacetylase family protein [Clostridiales Family XIII bacterium]|nr:polysaccharide deacetylase family protein [Clostridiales Family XIII bacterium]